MEAKGFTQYRVIVASLGMLLFAWSGSAQTTQPQNKAQLFRAYFEALAAEPHTAQRGNPHAADREQLFEIIPTMTTAELKQVIPAIDTAIDQARDTHDGIARMYAGTLLYHIAATKDGPGLLAPEIEHLSALCSDPFTLIGSFLMFQFLQSQYPDLRVPEMLRAVQSADASVQGGKGPAYATLLFLQPDQDGLVHNVVAYMQRPDLKGRNLLDFLNGISAHSGMPDAVVDQLTHYLHAPQEEVRLAALRDISGGGFAKRRQLRPMFEQLANDSTQSATFHALAVELLESNKIFYLNPYQ